MAMAVAATVGIWAAVRPAVTVAIMAAACPGPDTVMAAGLAVAERAEAV